jgi:hypothetical protein
MSLSTKAKLWLKSAIANASVAQEVSAAIDAFGSGPAANVAAIGAVTTIPNAACAGGSTPTATQVNTAINTVTAVAETRLENLETKLNAVVAALIASGQMSSS